MDDADSPCELTVFEIDVKPTTPTTTRPISRAGSRQPPNPPKREFPASGVPEAASLSQLPVVAASWVLISGSF